MTDVATTTVTGTATVNDNNTTTSIAVSGATDNSAVTVKLNNIRGAGSDVINGGAGNDLGIYALSDHYYIDYSTNPSGVLKSIAGDVDHYNGNGGTNTLRIVVTADEYKLVQSQLAAYKTWLGQN